MRNIPRSTMKTLAERASGNRSGMALIIVLAAIMLLTVLVVAFLLRAGLARTSSANYRTASATHILADTAVNLVQAEINEATASSVRTDTWASQPGAIRTFDNAGSLKTIYRLYSSSSQTTTKYSDLASDIPPTTWASSPAQWVDLNAPVTVAGVVDANGNPLSIYPILDPRDPTSATSPAAVLTSAKLPGFSLTSPPGATTSQPAPMPVHWLYVLQNGQIVPPTGGTGTTVTFTSPNAPTTTNPVVGRIAFWTDDETCKVNINTAGGSLSYRTDTKGITTATPVPAPWDTPRFAGSWDDVKLFAEDQPVAGEYQRYPGHPASTILYNIFNALGVNMPEIGTQTAAGSKLGYTLASNTQSGGSTPTGITSSLYGLLPRYNDDYGSQGGVGNTTASNAPKSPTVNRSRLYTSLGELLYSTNASAATPPVRIANGTLVGGAPPPVSPFLTRQQIETGKFFLTAHSRAPDVTLFGTPRITIWPVPDTTKTSVSPTGTPTQTTIDKLISFCSTSDTGKGQSGYKYYFQRYDRTSPTNDWTNEPRNQSLFSYLQAMTSASIPGYGGNFLSKYGLSNTTSIASERDQILTEIIDYIRCTNLNDHGNPSGTNFSPTGEVVPLKITKSGSTTSGLGRIATLSEIGLHVICTADGTNNLAAINASNANTGYTSTGNSGNSVVYNTPQIVATVSATIPVSPVIGSASDPAYVSNLPATQFLRDTSNNIVDVYGTTVTSANVASCTPFPANQTLTATGKYGDPLAAVPIGSKQLQAELLFEMASPMNGYDIMSRPGVLGPDFNLHVTNIQNIPIAGQNPFPNRTDASNAIGPNVNGNGYLNGSTAGTTAYGWNNNGDPNEGGIFGFRFPMTYYILTNTNTGKSTRCNGWSGKGPLTPQGTSTNDTLGTSSSTAWTPFAGSTMPYRFVSNPFTVSSTTLALGGSGSSNSFNVSLEIPITNGGATSHVPYQTYTVALPSVTLASTPTLCAYGFKYSAGSSTAITHAADWWGFDNRIGWCNTSTYVDNANQANQFGNNTVPISLGCVIRGDNAAPSGGWGTATNPWSYLNTTGTTAVPTTAAYMSTGATSYGDVVRSIVPIDCDYRVTMARPSSADFSTTINADPASTNPDFIKTPQYATTSTRNTNLFAEPKYTQGTTGVDVTGSLINLGGVTIAPAFRPKAPSTYSATTPNPQNTWDWDNGNMSILTGGFGAYAGKADEGDVYTGGNSIPYNNSNNYGTLTSYFTANRMLSSPVAFGSLPTGVAEGIPWRTLLFRPQLNRATYTTPLAATPKDELLLDLFNMPVVQPYAISETFSTAGKVNMNYQILPFTYIRRDTAVRAVIGSELIARMPLADITHLPFNPGAYYAGAGQNPTQPTAQSAFLSNMQAPGGAPAQARLPINLDETTGTLAQFENKFSGGDIFRSAAEICDLYLVPYDAGNTTLYTNWMTGGSPYTAADTSWYGSDFALVGDNVREHPYGDLYARLTTKSNTFTVHFKVQVLKNPPTADQTKWDESTGVTTGEYRGSTTLERYLDPNNNNIPDYASAADPTGASGSGAASLDSFYQWRVVANNAFSP